MSAQSLGSLLSTFSTRKGNAVASSMLAAHLIHTTNVWFDKHLPDATRGAIKAHSYRNGVIRVHVKTSMLSREVYKRAPDLFAYLKTEFPSVPVQRAQCKVVGSFESMHT